MLSAAGVGCFAVVDNLYFQGKGYSPATIGALVAVFNISVAVSEIPAAVVFDRRSHWLAIQLGNLVRTSALLLFFLSWGVGADAVAEVLAGVGAAAMTGTSTAYVLNRLSDEPSAQRIAIGRIAWISAAASLAGGVIGAAVFAIDPRTIWLAGATCMAAAGCVFLVGRPRRVSARTKSEPLRRYLRGLGALSAHPRAWLSILANAALIAPLILWQLRLGACSLTAVLLGFAVMKAAGVIGGRLMSGRRVPRGTLFALIGGNAVAILVFASCDVPAVILVCFGVHVVAHVAISVYCSASFQEVVPAHRRAGASSVVSLLSSGLTSIAALAVGVLVDKYSALVAVLPSLLLYGLVAVIAAATSLSARRRTRGHNESPRPVEATVD
ncbi:hypothetical protein A0130_11100 [Leifsonia xyli]|nr:hypothetical protein A0130_11100 [Leifsonia xyli]